MKNLFSIDFDPIDTNNILDNHKYLMKITRYRIMFMLIKKIFIGFLNDLVNGSNHPKCVSLSNQKYEIQPTHIKLLLMNTVKNFISIHLQLN